MNLLTGKYARSLGGLAVAVAGALVGYRLATPDPDLDATGAARPQPVAIAGTFWGRTRGVDPQPEGDPGRHALLIGVTRYEYLRNADLEGPANDVALFRELLVSVFGADPHNVVCLVEAERAAEARPTRANIEREFRRLAERVRPGDQVVILLAGHGARQPEADPPDPVHPEPDGIDEIFLPADARPWDGEARMVPGAITDNEIGAWLKRITDKKAHVWAVFDCCHSGNITRDSRTEVLRELRADQLVPREALDDARQRAAGRGARAAEKPGRFTLPEPDEFLVATYACRADEPTPEERLPDGESSRYHGLFSYTLCSVLTQARSPITYRELVQRVQIHYAARPRAPATPTVEGPGQDREVMGTRRWPERSRILLRRDRDGHAVNAGELHGLTPGSVLAVDAAAGAADAGARLGYVRVTEVAPAAARVIPCAFDGLAARDSFPDNAIARVAFTDYGARRLRLALDLPPGATRDAVTLALDDLADLTGGVVELVQDLRRAEWLIRSVGDQLVLVDPAAPERPFALPPPEGRRDFRLALREHLDRIYRARNLLRVAARADAAASRGESEVRVEVELLRNEGEDAPGVARALEQGGLVLRAGEYVSFRVRNRSDFKVDVCLLIVDSSFDVSCYYPLPVRDAGKQSIGPGDTFDTPVPHGLVGDKSFGPEQLVLIATRAGPVPADFSWLQQRGAPAPRGAPQEEAFKCPLGQFLASSVFRSGTTRGLSHEAARDVGIRVIPWRTVPASR